MPRYHQHNRRIPLRDAGLVEFASDDPGACELLEQLTGKSEEGEDGRVWKLEFDRSEPFLRLVNSLHRRLDKAQREAVRCRIVYSDPPEGESGRGQDGPDEDAADGWLPVGFLFVDTEHDRAADLIVNRRFTSYMQPIVQPGGRRIGYEFLLRPLPEQPPFRPAKLFDAAREAGLHSYLDREARHSAIRLAANHTEPGIKKFVNFLPSSLYRPSECLMDTFRFIREYGMDPEDFVFEVVETERMDDLRHWLDIFELYRKEGIRLAMDDVGEKFATVEAMERLRPDYVKLDRQWIAGCHADADKQRHIDEVLDKASRFHGVVLAEGVEDEMDWQYLARSGVPLMQGYLFGIPSPVPLPAPVRV
ncbi:EAL domain-containing protein [Cohnella zeiphila]|uniref:EAL domain-containing protein n=1 Tax=Cohnella zeiphila TaxID=2761120 RepID=A0A7X0SMZ2_9BACL|nr:EAL domain-containing protein [Cohnella zeiphila]MBB6731849.1 EAL domain-containing protein [Cohnella zeiphila]